MHDQWLILFTLVFARVGGMVMTAPIFGAGAVPARVRVLLAVALTFLIAPVLWQGTPARIDGPAQFFALLGGEAIVGACLGLGVLIFVHAMTIAGTVVSHAAGLSIAETFDPAAGEIAPQLSRFMFLLALCVFFLLGGHRAAMAGLLDTFRAIPPGSGAVPDSLAEGVCTLVAQSFSLAVRAAAPALTALLLATLTLGLIGRTLPQLNVLVLGFGVNAMLTFAVLAVALGIAVWAFADQIAPALETMFDALQTPFQGEWLS
ncbi:MAG: flagellar biosynthetic protein FliR [Pirellulales bacterium]|nr:flagellar biosynthetic protein FliR [Pirellulales bacterium]